MKVEERLLKYVGYHTTSDEASDKIPSSDREFALARELESELKELGLSKVVLHAGSGRQQTIHVTMVSEHNLG